MPEITAEARLPKRSSSVLRLAYGSAKGLAIVAGLLGSFIGLMALAGTFTDNGWLRAGLALLVTIGLPLLIAGRLLPDDVSEGKGIVSDVFAVTLLAGALLFSALGGPLLLAEGTRLRAADQGALAGVADWMAGGRAPVALTPEPPTAAPSAAEDEGHEAEEPKQKSDPEVAAESGKATSKLPTADKDALVPLTPAEIFQKWAASVVSVRVDTRFGQGSGTGFILAEDGTLATNHHVIDNARSVRVKLKDGTLVEKVELLAVDAEADLAILRIETDVPLTPVFLADSDTVTVGEPVISIGNPLGLEHTLTDGLVSARRVVDGRRMIQMSAPISPGNSGGPLFNATGEVVGVSTAGHRLGNDLNLAVPINEVKKLVKVDGEYPERRVFGASTW